MTYLELIIDFYRGLERQGPGSVEETLKALELVEISKKGSLKIADIGCGAGGQTMTLAKNIDGEIMAVDLFSEFIKELNLKAEEAGVGEKVKGIECSMETLPFAKEELDIIWSEGAIYNIGFERGIKEWKRYLKVGGYIAVSEVTWLGVSRPKEIDEFWSIEYPQIDTASNKIKILEKNGYSSVGYFVLKKESWLDNYYKPIEEHFNSFLEKHKYSEGAKEIVKGHKKEIELYKKYSDYYNYGFYIAKKL